VENTVRERLLAAGADVSAHYQEREEVVRVLLVAMLSGTNPLLLGPPGTAKSAVLNSVIAHVSDARSMVKLITAYTTEDELIGPPRLSGLRNDVYERNLDGGLAGVEVAFLDEVFKGPSAILNTTLSCINEHTYNGKQVPLRMCVAASNELPSDDSLQAINDRFLLRVYVDSIKEDSSFDALLCAAADPARRNFTANPEKKVSLSEWDTARAEVAQVILPLRVRAEMGRIRKACESQSIYVSGRRWTHLVKVLQAAAWLDGCAEVELDHLEILQHGLWTKLDDRETVKAMIATIDSGEIKVIVDVADQALRHHESCKNMSPRERSAEASKVIQHLVEAAEDIKKRVKAGVSGRVRRKAETKIQELAKAHAAVREELKAQLLSSV
jgi:MoxR-like ATPase